MSEHLSAAELRRWATRCAAEANDASDAEARDRLNKMRAALLQLAQTQDWLDGRNRAVIGRPALLVH